MTRSRDPLWTTHRRMWTSARRAVTAVVALLVVSLLATGCEPNLGVDQRWKDPSSIAWRDCSDDAREILGGLPGGVDFECGTVQVPRDWSQPDGEKFSLALMRVHQRSMERRVGSLLVNPGGPGASGVELAAYASAFLPLALRKRFDIVGFDPRGVGDSAPIRCISDKEKDESVAADPDPREQAQFDTSVADSRDVARECARKYDDKLELYGTEQAARDMDAIREAVGDPKLNYLGYSYGTLLGAVYAKLFPTRIRAMVLDGAVDPQQDSVAGSESQAAGFEKAFDNFATNCQRRGAACRIGPDARASVNRILDEVRSNPVEGDDGREATAGHVLGAVVSALYAKTSWTQLDRALADIDEGDPDGVFRLVDQYNDRDPDGHYDNSTDANVVINCVDDGNPPTTERVRQLQEEWRGKYPLFGGPLAMTLLNCAVWADDHDPYPVGEAEGAPPIVVVGTVGDPATPYENTAKLAELLGTGRVLTWEGEGHTAYPQTRCVTDAVSGYLINLKVPAEGKRCPAVG